MTVKTIEEQINQWSHPAQKNLAELMYEIFKGRCGKWPEGREYLRRAYELAGALPVPFQDRFSETPDQVKLAELEREAGGSFYVEDGQLEFLRFEEMRGDERWTFEVHTGLDYQRGIDIAGYSRNNELLLAVEVKKKIGASLEWAVQLRRNLLANPHISKSQYFLLATPNAFYLWKNTGSTDYDASPDYEIDAKEVLAPYLDRFSLSLEEISAQGFELLIATCLQDLISSDFSLETAPPHLQWLFESGLYNALKNGLVLMEEAA